jgi:hypothetical protein
MSCLQLLKLLETRLQRTMHEELRNGIWVIPMRVASLPSHPDVEGSRLVWRRMNLGPFKALNIRDIEDFSIEDHLRQADHYLVMPGVLTRQSLPQNLDLRCYSLPYYSRARSCLEQPHVQSILRLRASTCFN